MADGFDFKHLGDRIYNIMSRLNAMTRELDGVNCGEARDSILAACSELESAQYSIGLAIKDSVKDE